MNKKKLFFTLLISVLVISSNSAFSKDLQDLTDEPPKQIDISNKNTITIVVLPSASQVMRYLAKLNQKIFVPNTKYVISDNKFKLAMNLGISTADGAAALKNKDVVSLGRIGVDIISYGESLDVGENLLNDGLNITSFILKQEWRKVEILLDEMKTKLLIALQIKDREIEGQLASVSGWVEGLYIMTETVKDNFDTKFDNAFYIGNTITYLIKNLSSLPDDIKKMKEASILIELLPKIEKIVSKEHITKEEFIELNELSKKIRTVIIN